VVLGLEMKKRGLSLQPLNRKAVMQKVRQKFFKGLFGKQLKIKNEIKLIVVWSFKY